MKQDKTLPTGDQLRAIARSVRTSASDDASPSELVLAGWKAAIAAQSVTNDAAPVARVVRREIAEGHDTPACHTFDMEWISIDPFNWVGDLYATPPKAATATYSDQLPGAGEMMANAEAAVDTVVSLAYEFHCELSKIVRICDREEAEDAARKVKDKFSAQVRAALAAQSHSERNDCEFALRGQLAAALRCWHRLSGEEADELVAFFTSRTFCEVDA